jgi:hypothetical protein
VKTRYLIAFLSAAVALALVAAGCGSSSKSSISKAEFVKKGNAICANGSKEIDAAGKRIFGTNPNVKPSADQIRKFASTVLLPSVEKQVKALRALGAPKGDEAKVKAILDAADQGIEKGKKDPASLASNGAGPFAKANSLAKAYGLPACGG